jgi:hypothetical protein
MTYQEQRVDLVMLNRLQGRRKIKLRQNNDTVTAVDTRVADDDKAIDV